MTTPTRRAGTLTAADIGAHIHLPRLRTGGILTAIDHRAHATTITIRGTTPASGHGDRLLPHTEPVVTTPQEVEL